MGSVNKSTNPAAKNNLTGWSGSATISRVTTLTGMERATGVHLSSAGYVTPPTVPVSPGDIMTVSFYVNNASGLISGAKTVYFAYTRSSGGDVFPETFTFNVNSGEKKRVSATTTLPAPALATGLYLVIDGIAGGTGGGYDFTSVMFEPGSTLNPYGDGDSSGWVWDGADGNSASHQLDGPQVFVYNGSIEVPGTVTVWNGSSELPGIIEIAP